MKEPQSQGLAVVHDFLAQYAADLEAGIEPTLERYQALFPGHEELIAREFDELESDSDGSDETAVLGAGEQIGPYRLLETLGHGGQGVVHLAEDTRLGRRVALKLLSSRRALSGQQLARFRREAETASRLDHPGICTVYEAGELDGAPFLAMQYVDGESLAARIRRVTGGPLADDSGIRRRLLTDWITLLERLARAVHVAHEAGIVHRDIKPQNVMVDRDGQPVILDFGLAQDETNDDGLTLSGDLVGTPAYMPPERLVGGALANDPRVDVYGLGVILFECVTGAPPFVAPTRDRLYRDIVQMPVPDARRMNPFVPADLQLVLEVALEKDPNRRYRSVAAFADDLGRVNRREPIRARQLPTALLARRWIQRHPALSASVAAIFALLSLGFAVALTLLASRDAARDRSHGLALAGESLRVGEFSSTLALLLAEEAYVVNRSPATLSQLYRATGAARRTADIRHRPGTGATGVTTLWTPDRQRLVTIGFDGTAQIRKRDGTLVADVTHATNRKTWCRSADIHPGGTVFVTTGDDGFVRIWRVADGALLHELKHEASLTVSRVLVRSEASARFSPDGALLVTGTARGHVTIWDVETGEKLWCWPDPDSDAVACLAWSPDGRHVVAGFQSGRVRVWPVVDGRGTRGPVQLVGHAGSITGIAFPYRWPDQAYFATGSADGSVRIWSPDGRCLAPPRDGLERTLDVAFAPDGEELVAAGINGLVKAWRAPSGAPVRDVAAYAGVASFARFSPDGRLIVTGGADGIARVFNRRYRQVDELRGHSSLITDLVFLDSTTVCTTCHDGSVGLWQLGLDVVFHDDRLTALAVADDGTVAVAADGQVFVGDLEQPLARRLGPPHATRIWHLALSRDGTLLAAASVDPAVSVWDLRTGEELWRQRIPGACAVAFGPEHQLAVGRYQGVAVVAGHDASGMRSVLTTTDEVFGVAFSEDGRRIAAAGSDGSVHLVENGRARVVGRHAAGVVDVAFSPRDGSCLVSASMDGTVGLYSLSEDRFRLLQGHRNRAHAIAFSPDGARFVTTSWDRTAKMWNRDGTLHATLAGHRGGVLGAGFTPIGDRILTVSVDATMRLWPATPADLRSLAKQRAFRRLTAGERATYDELNPR